MEIILAKHGALPLIPACNDEASNSAYDDALNVAAINLFEEGSCRIVDLEKQNATKDDTILHLESTLAIWMERSNQWKESCDFWKESCDFWQEKAEYEKETCRQWMQLAADKELKVSELESHLEGVEADMDWWKEYAQDLESNVQHLDRELATTRILLASDRDRANAAELLNDKLREVHSTVAEVGGLVLVQPSASQEQLQSENQQLREQLEQQRRLCIVCCENEVNTSFVPCGHAKMCQDCVTNYVGTDCPMCRQPCTGTQRLYLD